MLLRPEEYQRMAGVEARHWWYRALHQLVADALKLHPRGKNARIIDAGCGTGGLLSFLRARGCDNLSGFDLSPEAVRICHERGLPVQTGDLRDLNQLLPPRSAEVIVSNDTLYFFDHSEQSQLLNFCAQALAPGGLLVMNVPASNAFRGIHDLSVGIRHRFSAREIRQALASAQLDLARLRAWPFFLSPFIYLRRAAQRRLLERQPGTEIRSDIDLPHPPVNAALSLLTRLENRLMPWKPFGSSLFVVARKKTNTTP